MSVSERVCKLSMIIVTNDVFIYNHCHKLCLCLREIVNYLQSLSQTMSMSERDCKLSTIIVTNDVCQREIVNYLRSLSHALYVCFCKFSRS